jgi:hypothetical protein
MTSLINEIIKFTFKLPKSLDNFIDIFRENYEIEHTIKISRQDALILLIRDGLRYNCIEVEE